MKREGVLAGVLAQLAQRPMDPVELADFIAAARAFGDLPDR